VLSARRLIGVLRNGLQFNNVSSYTQSIVSGLILILAVAFRPVAEVEGETVVAGGLRSPPSVLPDISPSRGEIGWRFGLRQFSTP